MNVRYLTLPTAKATKSEESESDLALLSSEDYAGAGVTADDVHVRRMLLCHDQYDRTYERFDKRYLGQFAKTLPGKSMLANHDAFFGGNLPLARFFAADVTRKKESDFPVPAGIKAPGDPAGAAEDELLVNYLRAKFYFVSDETNEPMRKNIDLGVWKWVSIGFRYDDIDCDICGHSYFKDCPHIIGRFDQDSGRMCTGTYSGDVSRAEALEGSIVYLGAQPRARLIKSLVDHNPIDIGKASVTPAGEDLVARKEAEYIAKLAADKGEAAALADLQGIYDFASDPRTGERFAETIQTARTAVDVAIARAEEIAAKRIDTGRTAIAQANVQDLENLKASMARLNQLLDSPEAKALPEVERLRSQSLDLDASIALALAQGGNCE